MGSKEIAVTFETITPLWTGDAWQECKEIRPSSLIGSLRFWFEVICYFAGICEKNDFNFKNSRFEKEVERNKLKECLLKKGNFFEAKIECLVEQGIPLPSIIFGTTNWRSLIEIKKVEFYKNNFKEEPVGKILSNKNWYFGKPSYQEEFSVIFKIEEKILKSIFYPLLTFMNKYGFWGGKWNIGYGRLKVLDVKENNKPIENWRNENFLFSRINKNYGDKSFKCFIKDNISQFNFLTEKENKIQLFISYNSNNSFIEIIKELIKTKAQRRAEYNTNTEERHKIFGKTGNPRNLPYVPQGSKILPYINRTQRDKFPYDCGFLSIAGLLNLEGGINE